MNLVISEQAELDLARIADWISRDNPARAVTFVNELERVCERVAEHPLAFPEIESMPGIRKRGYGKYIVLFEVDEVAQTATIITIRHGARGSLTSI